MPRPIDHQKRAALREAAADYILANGLIGLSLRPLAEALKTSHRMLIHHFGSRETLLREAVETIREREATRFKRWLKRRRASPPTLPSLLRWHWKRLSAPQARPALRFFFEMYVLALYDPSQPAWMVGVPLAYWRGVLGQEPSEELETLIPATFRGLLLDLLATGERRRVERAFTAFVKRVAGGSA